MDLIIIIIIIMVIVKVHDYQLAIKISFIFNLKALTIRIERLTH
jgi:hypothetical protein